MCLPNRIPQLSDGVGSPLFLFYNFIHNETKKKKKLRGQLEHLVDTGAQQRLERVDPGYENEPLEAVSEAPARHEVEPAVVVQQTGGQVSARTVSSDPHASEMYIKQKKNQNVYVKITRINDAESVWSACV